MKRYFSVRGCEVEVDFSLETEDFEVISVKTPAGENVKGLLETFMGDEAFDARAFVLFAEEIERKAEMPATRIVL